MQPNMEQPKQYTPEEEYNYDSVVASLEDDLGLFPGVEYKGDDAISVKVKFKDVGSVRIGGYYYQANPVDRASSLEGIDGENSREGVFKIYRISYEDDDGAHSRQPSSAPRPALRYVEFFNPKKKEGNEIVKVEIDEIESIKKVG